METLSRKLLLSLFIGLGFLVSLNAVAEELEARPLWSVGNLGAWVWVMDDAAVDSASVWEFDENGALLIHGGVKGYLRTKEVYWNYRLRVEWRWAAAAGNGGLLVNIDAAAEDTVWPACYQLQLKSGHVGELIAMEGATVAETIGKAKTTALLLEESNESALGAWNVCEVVVRDGLMEFWVNGVLQNRGSDPSLKSGYIGLQLEGQAIAYRSATVTPLD